MANQQPQQQKERWTSIPAQRRNAAALKAAERTLWVVLIGGFALGPLAFLLTMVNQPDVPEQVHLPEARWFATQALEDTLVRGGTDLPKTASVPVELERVDKLDANVKFDMAWQGFGRVTDDGDVLEAHRFVITPGATTYQAREQGDDDAGNRLLRATVVVRLAADGPVLDNGPTIEPFLLASSQQTRTAYPELKPYDGDAGDVINRRTQTWMTAWGADDRTAISDLTGDTAGRTYIGLGGYDVEGTVGDLWWHPTLEDTAIVRVEMRLTGDGIDTVSAMDLLVGQASTAQPNIVSWGPAGSGLYLAPYDQAVG